MGAAAVAPRSHTAHTELKGGDAICKHAWQVGLSIHHLFYPLPDLKASANINYFVRGISAALAMPLSTLIRFIGVSQCTGKRLAAPVLLLGSELCGCGEGPLAVVNDETIPGL